MGVGVGVRVGLGVGVGVGVRVGCDGGLHDAEALGTLVEYIGCMVVHAADTHEEYRGHAEVRLSAAAWHAGEWAGLKATAEGAEGRYKRSHGERRGGQVMRT